MSERILFVMDDPGWIQAARHAELARRLPEHELVPLSAGSFARRWRLGRYRRAPIYLASWRLFETLEDSHRVRIDEGRTMVSVTSHYGIGGGLRPDRALRAGVEHEAAFAQAIETLQRCAVVTANSSGLRDLLAPHLPQLVYAPNGVDHEAFRPPAERDYDPERLRIGWAGKLKAAKNADALLAAKQALEREGFRFELVGGPKSEAPPLDAAGMRAFYHRIDWYLCTSWHEGTPNPALEAAASGVPLVTTRVGNMVDLVVDGENGFFVEPDAESVIARLRSLRGLTSGEHARLGGAARAAIERDWTWDARVAAYREAFERLLAAA